MTLNHDGPEDDRMTVDPDARTYTARVADESPTLSVVRAVSAVIGVAPENVRPLYHTVDPDALDRLFAPTDAGAERSGGVSVRFRFHRCDVSVHADGRIVVSPDEDAV